jgi:DNA repair photolyase
MTAQAELLSVGPAHASGPSLTVLDRRRRGATFVEHTVKSIVNSPESTGMGFWSINPYVGCEFGCTYCYARYAHRYVTERAHEVGRITSEEFSRFQRSPRWESFEYQIFIKRRETVLEALERDLGRMRRRSKAHPLVIGTATDPYQPAERQFQLTRAILERLRRERDLKIGLITKSPLVCRDIDLLVDLRRRHRLTVYISLISVDTRLIKLFEARSPMPHVRLKALRRLAEAGLEAGLIVAPVLPGITDTVSQIRALLQGVEEAGGRFVHPVPLRLYPPLHRGFLPLVEAHFPDLAVKYRRTYRGALRPPRRYRDALSRRFRQLAAEIGIPVGDPTSDDVQAAGNLQLDLLER